MGRWVFLLCLLVPAPGHAQEESHIRWSDAWARAHPASYVLQPVAFSFALVFDHFYEPPAEASARGPVLFDAEFRRTLRAGAEEDRERAATLSDVLVAGLLFWPVVDAIAVAGLGYQSSDAAWQLLSVTIEVVAVDFLLGTVIKALVHRERPHGDQCNDELRSVNPARCNTSGRTRSLYSGHASAAFASAGNVCMAHAFLPLYGDGALDAFACGGALVTASIVGVLRMLADRHWISDVLVGSLIGLATGLVLPYVLHYGWDLSDPDIGAARAPLTSSSPTFSLGFSF